MEAASKENLRRKDRLADLDRKFNLLKSEFEQKKTKINNAVDQLRKNYFNLDPVAVREYCDLVLERSNYPDYFPKQWDLEYRHDNKMVVVNYDLPSPDQMPTIESYKYIASRREVTKKEMTEAKRKNIFNATMYQICIRTIHELLEADTVDAIDIVAFNGVITSINPATGITESKIIMSVSSAKDQFLKFDLSKVDPKATFKHLKGVSAASLVDLTPIPPVVEMNKEDRRFIEGKDVLDGVNSSVNLAAMKWDDFEHLIRELFEKEFRQNGGEVKVTQASADGGVDAIAYDPDPIRGGKIVIQAKRYTNVVGVAAVRDLYGTVMNEGATKGILVTTSDYGKDSYEFAKDKPLSLLNGSNLLSLLEKHGQKARINIKEAKKILNK